MLKNKQRQNYLKDLGFYKGSINGKFDAATKDALVAFQKSISPKEEATRSYTAAVDKMLVSAHRCLKLCQLNGKQVFTLQEFKCGCGGKYCKGYPAYVSDELLRNLMTLRQRYGRPMTITSGLRCSKYNAALVGSIPNSKHKDGLAVDFYMQGKCDTKAGRDQLVKEWLRLPDSTYSYANTPNMGNAVHVDVQKNSATVTANGKG